LTSREVEVLGLLAEGLSDREIAGALSISERTAGNHVQHAMQKIGVESRTAAAVFAIRHQLDGPAAEH
jgi:DNA-binding NarL/FixJ family response regulator